MADNCLFTTLLSPAVSLAQFFSEHWQQAPLHIPNRNPAQLAHIFDALHDTEEMWANAQRHAADDALLYFQRQGERVALPSPFFAFAHRCSVVVNKADRYSARLLALCHRLQRRFPFVYTNVYLTPPNAQSVPAHSDDREVLLLQIHGSKRWTVYGSPVRLPFKDEEMGKEHPASLADLKVVLECELAQGDVLYLPRGFVHVGVAGNQPSMHITVALQSSDWDARGLVVHAIADAARLPALQRARECIPPPLLAPEPSETNEDTMAAAAAQFDQLLQDCAAAARGQFVASLGAFHARLSCLRRERDALARSTISPAPIGLALGSLIVWNPCVRMQGFTTDNVDGRVATVDRVVHLERLAARHGSDGIDSDVVEEATTVGAMHMSLACSAEVFACFAMLRDAHRDVPARVADLPMCSDLAKLALSYFLLNNSTCVLVSL